MIDATTDVGSRRTRGAGGWQVLNLDDETVAVTENWISTARFVRAAAAAASAADADADADGAGGGDTAAATGGDTAAAATGSHTAAATSPRGGATCSSWRAFDDAFRAMRSEFPRVARAWVAGLRRSAVEGERGLAARARRINTRDGFEWRKGVVARRGVD